MNPLLILKAVYTQLPGISVTFVLATLFIVFYAEPRARKEGKDAYIAELAIADAKNEAISKGKLSDLQNLSDHEFCVRSLTRRKLPVDACEQLLGMGKE